MNRVTGLIRRGRKLTEEALLVRKIREGTVTFAVNTDQTGVMR
jgi:hypothetical protein